MTPVFGVTGWKNSGKTTLVERLVRNLTERGYRIATIKHAHHAFDIDREGTDSFRHRQAGAHEVALVSGFRWALMHEVGNEGEPTLEAMTAHMSPADLIVIEGYKSEPHAKIEVRREAARKNQALAARDDSIVAIAADHEVTDTDLPVFDIDDIDAITDFILNATRLGSPGHNGPDHAHETA